MSSYSEQLHDPRWQKKRLEILERDGWKCRGCFREEKELHVHHAYYRKGKKPWEYDNAVLSTFCGDCHAKISETNKIICQALSNEYGTIVNCEIGNKELFEAVTFLFQNPHWMFSAVEIMRNINVNQGAARTIIFDVLRQNLLI